jgi:hypothetical protein
LEQARQAAGDRDVAIAGGAATVNQYLAAGVPPLQLELLAVRAASLTTHISYRVLH